MGNLMLGDEVGERVSILIGWLAGRWHFYSGPLFGYAGRGVG